MNERPRKIAEDGRTAVVNSSAGELYARKMRLKKYLRKSRWWFLLASLLLLALPVQSNLSIRSTSASAPPPKHAAAVRVRKNIDDLMKPENAAELRNLRHAFEVVMQRSKVNPNDPNGYLVFADFHNTTERGPCVHLTDVFAWWHRAHLAAFEKLLQDSDPDNPQTPTRDVMLPYWDWTAQPSGQNGYPKAFEEVTTAEGTPNPFIWPNPILCPKIFCQKRKLYPGGGPPYLASSIAGLLKKDWPEFGGTIDGPGDLEKQPHNTMHGKYVRGDMGNNTTAAKDPIFWVFHTNIDRVLEKWQQLHEADRCSATPDPGNISCVNCDLKGTGGNWPPTGVVKDVLCSETLGYQYADLPSEMAPAPFAALKARDMAPSSSDAVEKNGTPLSFSFKIPATITDRAYLNIKGLVIPSQINYIVRIYLHPKSVKFSPGNSWFADQYFASFFTVWAINHGTRGAMAGHGNVADFRENITKKLAEAVQTGAGTDWVASLIFTALPPNGERPAKLRIGREVQYSKISIELTDAGALKELELKTR